MPAVLCPLSATINPNTEPRKIELHKSYQTPQITPTLPRMRDLNRPGLPQVNHSRNLLAPRKAPHGIVVYILSVEGVFMYCEIIMGRR